MKCEKAAHVAWVVIAHFIETSLS